MTDLSPFKKSMDAAIASLKSEFAGLRTGRASAALLEPIMVEAYGSNMPMNQVGAISVPEARMMSVNVWDKGLVVSVEKAIRNAGLGLNPVVDGTTVRVPMPALNEERRKELVKMAGKYAETSRVSVRNVRREANDMLKKAEKDGDISQDEQKGLEKEVQALTDQHIEKIDELLKAKEAEIMQV